jgi:hypothetical protein
MKPKAPKEALNVTPQQVIANVEAAKANKWPTRPRRIKGEVLTAKEVAALAKQKELDRPIQDGINFEAQQLVDPEGWKDTADTKRIRYQFDWLISYLMEIRDAAMRQDGASAFAARRLDAAMLESIAALKVAANSNAPGAEIARKALEKMAAGFQQATWAVEKARNPARKPTKRGPYSPAFRLACSELLNAMMTAQIERQNYRGTVLPVWPFGWLDDSTGKGREVREEWLSAFLKIAPTEFRDRGLLTSAEWSKSNRAKQARGVFLTLWRHYHQQRMQWVEANKATESPG